MPAGKGSVSTPARETSSGTERKYSQWLLRTTKFRPKPFKFWLELETMILNSKEVVAQMATVLLLTMSSSSGMEVKSASLSMEILRNQMLEKDGKCSMISLGGGAKVSKSDQLTFTTADGEKLRFVNLMVTKMPT